MGRPKLTLPLGNQRVIERVLDTLKQAGIPEILVVVGPAGAELESLVRTAGIHVVRLPADTLDMRTTVEHGLNWLQQHFQPRAEDYWLLVPADHPTLDAGVIHDLIQARAGDFKATIFLPTHAGRRGHPALIAWRHVTGIRAMPAGQGLNQYLRGHDQETREVPVASADVLTDLDTPEDYQRLQERFAHEQSPAAPL